jgi:hypothetical protein
MDNSIVIAKLLKNREQKERIIDEGFTLDSIAAKIIKQKLQTYIL